MKKEKKKKKKPFSSINLDKGFVIKEIRELTKEEADKYFQLGFANGLKAVIKGQT